MANQLPRPYPATLPWKLLEMAFRLFDLLLIPQILTLLNNLIKFNTRRLNDREIAIAKSIFRHRINYEYVRIDEKSFLGCQQYRFAYVGFRVINCWGSLPDQLLIHELVHVWQYQVFGSVYIPRALYAQRTNAGYNYGGGEAIKNAAMEGLSLIDFNWEQQADIVADYYCLQNDLKPRWCKPDKSYLPYFQRIMLGWI